ncbi:MAG: peroxiredoxin [Candidatus Binatia bacterium]
MYRLFLMLALLCIANPSAGAEMLQTGDPFPAWKLVDQTGAPVSSADLKGKRYLVWFYPKAATPGCTIEGSKLRDRSAEFREMGVEILGVSFDPPAANLEFMKEEGFPFRLLSDERRELAAAVGAAASSSQPTAARISYLVGADGKVLKPYPGVNPSTHAAEVLTDLAALPR